MQVVQFLKKTKKQVTKNDRKYFEYWLDTYDSGAARQYIYYHLKKTNDFNNFYGIYFLQSEPQHKDIAYFDAHGNFIVQGL